VAGRAQETLDRVLDLLESLSLDLALFRRWQTLFPGQESPEFIEAAKQVYTEVIGFIFEAIKYLRRNPIS
jgi:hypothetical protein